FEARMLPGVSAEDCLFADLGINPGMTGCQSFEATDFLVRRPKFDTRSGLILWQIGPICDLRFRTTRNLSGIRILVNYLQKYYEPAYEVVLYEAAQLPLCNPIIQRVPLARIPKTRFSPIATLYV